jgi:hypothetical protein
MGEPAGVLGAPPPRDGESGTTAAARAQAPPRLRWPGAPPAVGHPAGCWDQGPTICTLYGVKPVPAPARTLWGNLGEL